VFRFVLRLRLADASTTQAPQPAEEEVVIPAEAALELAGAVEGMVEGFLVVAADPARQTLDMDSALCFDDRTPLGRVHEVFGPVKKPYYAVLNAHVERLRAQGREALLTRGTPVYYVPQASCFVQPTIIYTRGSDASGEHDEEPPEDVRAPPLHRVVRG
jgi:H/ACA ribonucleoprotein complex non-core subunit NAF1